MTKRQDMDRLLHAALAPGQMPNEAMNLQLKAKMRGAYEMKSYRKPVFRTVLITAMVLVLLSATALAAWKLLSPGEVATELEYPALAAAFEAPEALVINETVTKGDYAATLLGVVSGKGLDGFAGAEDDKTYAVVAIAGNDVEARQADFFVSPLVKGLHPWEVNVASMGGGYSAKVIDDVLYRIVECDSVEMFADKGLYLCVSETSFYDTRAYNYDETTGEITENSDFAGLNALFTLPLDASLGDAAKAEAYLTALRAPQPEEAPDPEMEALCARVETFTPEDGELIEASVEVLEADEYGYVTHTYDGASTAMLLESLFADGQTGLSAEKFLHGDGETWFVTVFERDAEGTVRGMVYRLK